MQPYDESDIAPDDIIIRRIDPTQHVVWDSNRQCNRLSTKAFQPSSGADGGMSVDVEKLIVEAALDPYLFVTTPRFQGSVKFLAHDLRAIGLRIGYDPLLATAQMPANPYHGEVWGPPDRANKFTNQEKKKLLELAEWYVELTTVSLG